MGRPVGVTILAVLYFLGAVFCLLGGIGMMMGGGIMATLLNQQGQSSGGAAGLMAGLGAAFGVVILIFAALDALLGWGLWKLKNWARIITIVLMVISIGLQLLGLVGILAHFNLFSLILTVVFVAIYAWIVWYLLQPNVKAAFQAQARGASA